MVHFFFYLHRFFYLHNLKKLAFSITVSVYSREVTVHVQRGYRFCQFSKEGTDMDIHRGTCLSEEAISPLVLCAVNIRRPGISNRHCPLNVPIHTIFNGASEIHFLYPEKFMLGQCRI